MADDQDYDYDDFSGSGSDNDFNGSNSQGWLGSTSKSDGGVDVITEKKRRRVHRLSGITQARFSQHYQEHGSLLKTAPPAPSMKKTMRYGREAHRKECHWKAKKPKEQIDIGIQTALKGPSTSKYAKNSSRTREMITQTTHFVEVKPEYRDVGQQADIIIDKKGNVDEDMMALIKGLKTDCPGAHVPQGLMEEMSTALLDLMTLLKLVDEKADGNNINDKDILALMKKFKPIPCEGPHIPEKTIQGIVQVLNDVAEFMRNFQKDDYSQLVEFINSRMTELNDFLGELRREHNDIFRSLQNIQGQTCEGPHIPESYIREMHAYLQEILMLMKTETIMTTYVEPAPMFTIQKFCTCDELVKRANNDPKFAKQSFLTGMCQKCVNDHMGRQFILNLGMPNSMTQEILNLVGNIVQAIMDDNMERTKFCLREFKQNTPTWEPEEYQKCLEALLHLALIWDRQISAQYLATIVDVSAMFRKISENRRVYNLCDFVQSAAEAQNPEVLVCLLRALSPRDKVVVINSPAIYNERKVLSLFEAARRGDVKCFEILVEQGAELDILENGSSIMHALIDLADEKGEVLAAAEWEVCIQKMFDIIYNLAAVWWERTHGKYEKADDTVSGRKSALRYLFWHVENKDGLNPLEYAAQKGTPHIVRKIVNNPPYSFFPDPFGVGYYNGRIGYVVDHIDSAIVDKGFSVLEYMAQRRPGEGGPLLKIEPFRSLVLDKWNRYKPFFFITMIAYTCYMCIFTAIAMTRPPFEQKTFDEMYTDMEDYARLAGEIICLVFLPMFLYGEIRYLVRGRYQLWKPWDAFGLYRFLNILFVIGVITLLVLRCLRNINEDIVWSLCLLIGWTNEIMFLGAWKRCGVFSIAMRKVFIRDLLIRFLPTYLLLLLAISTATFVMFQEVNPSVPEYANDTFITTPFTLFKMTFSIQDADHATLARNEGMGIFLLIVHLLFGILIPFFMFLAMVGDTFTRYRERVKSNWIWVRANFAMYIENRLPAAFLIKYESGKNNEKTLKAQTIFGATQLQYVVKVERMRQKDGKVTEHDECSVLVKREDPPIPEVSPTTKEACRRLMTIGQVRGPPSRPPPPIPKSTRGHHTFENPLALTDLGGTGDSFGLATYESLPDSASAVVRLGRHNKVGNGRTTPL